MKVKAVIDRFEGFKAVLLVGDGEIQVVWPRENLPAGASEGDILKIAIAVDEEATRQARNEAEKLLTELLEKNQE